MARSRITNQDRDAMIGSLLAGLREIVEVTNNHATVLEQLRRQVNALALSVSVEATGERPMPSSKRRSGPKPLTPDDIAQMTTAQLAALSIARAGSLLFAEVQRLTAENEALRHQLSDSDSSPAPMSVGGDHD